MTCLPARSPALPRFAALLALCGSLVALHAPAAERSPFASRAAAADDAPRLIVRFKADSQAVRAQSVAASGATVELRQAHALSQRHGVALSDGRMLDARTQLIFGPGPSGGHALAQKLAADPQVEYVEVDRRVRARAVPNDPLYPDALAGVTPAVGQWYLRPPGSTFVSAINAQAAWDVTTGSASIVVAVLDTGVRPEHPDLAGKLVAGYDFVSDPAIANDGNGRDGDPSDPGEWVTLADVNSGALGSGCTSADVSDSSWHGTQTAGLVAAATNNGVGMAGSGYNVLVQPVRVLGKCGGWISDVVDAMKWAGGIAVTGVPANATPARVVNLSLGAEGACGPSFQDAVTQLRARNVIVVAAAGNGIPNAGGVAVDAPGNCTGAIAVAGVRHAGSKVGYSNLGPEVTVSAPAGNCINTTGACLYPILSTSNSGTQGPVSSTYTTSGADAGLGTSFSAPLVSGTLALMASANTGISVDALRIALRRTTRAFPVTGATQCVAPSTANPQGECDCTPTTCGAGMLDAGAALQAVAAGRVFVDITTPTTQPVAGQAFTVNALSVAIGTGRSITTRQWTVTSGNATITSGGTTDTVVITPQAAGTVTLQLSATDGTNSDTQSVTLTASAAPSGGGGGALDASWLPLAALALGALAWPHRRRVRWLRR